MGSIVLVYQRSQPWRPGMVLHCGAYPVTSVSFSADSSTLLTAANDGATRLWNLDTGEQLSTTDHKMMLQAAALAPSGKTYVTAGDDGKVMIHGPDLEQELFDFGAGAKIASLHFSNDGTRLVACAPHWLSNYGHIAVISVQNRNSANIYIVSDADCETYPIENSNRIVATTADGLVNVFQDGIVRPIAAMRGDSSFFRSAVFSPDGMFIATVGTDCTARLWTASSSDGARSILEVDAVAKPGTENRHTWTAKPLAILRGHKQYVLSSQFSPEGDRLATVSLDGSVRIWGGRDGAPLAVLSDKGPSRSVVFSPDGKRLASAGIDGTVQLWDRRCSERWYGKVMLPEFWLMLLLLPALLWSIRRDTRSLRNPGVPPGVTFPQQ